ncbi:VOC family protein [Catenuloplanes sp. NPDC051500]|uniref:VOC family protein n=1 Tax=Catenuloplanes sp. NPDC051500 TaxID=3363959 RepID=UPI00379553AD
MGRPVVHFEIIGPDPDSLRDYYGELFGWSFETGGQTAEGVSAPGQYGFMAAGPDSETPGIPGGIGGGAGFGNRALFYVGVPDVEAALQAAEKLGGTRLLGPVSAPGGGLVVGHFTDPQGNLVGLADVG